MPSYSLARITLNYSVLNLYQALTLGIPQAWKCASSGRALTLSARPIYYCYVAQDHRIKASLSDLYFCICQNEG